MSAQALTRPAAATRPRHATVLPWLLAAAVVGCQIAFPFTGGGTAALTVVTVWVFALASTVHAYLERGPAAAGALLGVAGGIGLAAEAVGVRTGLPFGDYAYTGTLGWQLLGVPVVVPLAWTMMAYPALLAGRRLASRLASRFAGRFAGRFERVATAVVAAWALASWDVFLDPQMVDAGHWRWADPRPGLPGVDGIPLTNFAGWLLVALVVVTVLDTVLPRGRAYDDRVPAALYLWTYGSSVLAHLAFFGRPPVALVGGVAMGVVAVPLAVSLWRGRR